MVASLVRLPFGFSPVSEFEQDTVHDADDLRDAQDVLSIMRAVLAENDREEAYSFMWDLCGVGWTQELADLLDNSDEYHDLCLRIATKHGFDA